MSSNRPPIELPPTIITPNPPPPPPAIPPKPVFEPWNQKILSPGAFGNFPFTYYDERYINSVVVALLNGVKEMRMGYEAARSSVAKNADASLFDKGFKAPSAVSPLEELAASATVLQILTSTTETQIPLEYAAARQFFNGRNPHEFGGVQAFNFMARRLYGKNQATRMYHAWIAANQAQYRGMLLEAQLAYLKQKQFELNTAIEVATKSRMVFSVPASQANTTPLVMSAVGTIPISATARLTLGAAVEAAVARMTAFAAATFGASVAIFAGMVYSSKLGDGERFPASVPLADLRPPAADLRSLAAANGRIHLPVRLGISNDGGQITYYAAATGLIPGDVRVRQAIYDANTGNYSFTTSDSPARTLVWTPIVHPGDSSTSTPATSPPEPAYRGPVITPVDPYIEVFPSVAEAGFDDYVIVFPADSGLEPIYIMFRDRRDEPGVATGNGRVITGAWLPQAATGSGAAIPATVADKLRGRTFSSFNKLREAFWTEVSGDPVLSNQFRVWQITRMREGLAPFVPTSAAVGGRIRYELHHVEYISEGGKVYDIDNLRVVTPRSHLELHLQKNEG